MTNASQNDSSSGVPKSNTAAFPAPKPVFDQTLSERALSESDKALIAAEEALLAEILSSLSQQRELVLARFRSEQDRARELTSELVAARRDEDKQALASDEAVSHALKDKQQGDILVLDKLLARPYFARLLVEEEQDGKKKRLEYRLGFAANPECRIIDWRRAPVSKLYYEYREGDDYFEVIQGNEREGRILARIGVDIKSGKLLRLSTSQASYEKKQGLWSLSSGARAGSSAGALQDIADLITPEQFRAITEDSTTAVLIQGIAGSGKTTVAFHRLSWLLKHEGAEIFADGCLVLVRSKALARYCSQVLPSMGIDEVPVHTFEKFLLENMKKLCPPVLDDAHFRACTTPTPSSLIRLKGSANFLKLFEEHVAKKNLQAKTPALLIEEFYPLLDEVFQEAARAEKNVRSGFGDKDLVDLARARHEENKECMALDPMDRCLFLRLVQLRFGGLPLVTGGLGKFDHIVVDEVQDFSSLELALIIDAVQEPNQLTLVGDAAQEIHGHSEFPGWDELRKRWKLGDEHSQYFSLTVSHRSTLPIMKLADAVQGRKTVTDGKAGRTPLWMHAKNESYATRSCISWLRQATERYPGALSAAICPDMQSAKYLHSLLSPSFGPLLRLGDDQDFSFDAGLVVTDIAHAKGLEFANVLLWDVSEQHYPYDRMGQNMLYVGITRACENVCILSWKSSSPCLPPRTSSVIRFVGVGGEEGA